MSQKNPLSTNVNHPDHYNQGDIECMDAMLSAYSKEEVLAFCKLNAFKYIWRANNKGKTLEDLQKADWYLDKVIELMDDTK